MFQFPSFASLPYFTWIVIIDVSINGVAPFGYVRVKACLAARRTLSWPTPSFFASHVPRHPSRALCRLSYLFHKLLFRTYLLYVFLREFILLLFNPIQNSPNNLKSD